jgi:hypothetical protein
MAEKADKIKPESAGWLKTFLKAADLPTNLTLTGLLGYAITHGLLGIGGKGGNVSVKGVSDEAGFQWLCATLKKLGGVYGENVSKSLISIHAMLYTMDQGTAEIFRGLLLSNLKEENLSKFFTDLLDAMPPSIREKQELFKAYLAGHTEPHIMLCVELHEQLEKIRTQQKISLEEATALLVKEALSSGEIPSTLTLQGKEKIKKALLYLDGILGSWSLSLEKRREEDPSRMYFNQNSPLGNLLSARWLGAFVRVNNDRVSINILATCIMIGALVSLITVLLQKP